MTYRSSRIASWAGVVVGAFCVHCRATPDNSELAQAGASTPQALASGGSIGAPLRARTLTSGAVVTGAAPGGPGVESTWGPAQKSFLGTAVSGPSRVYFTGYRGIVSEVFYPVLDTVDSVDLQFLVGDSQGTYVDEEKVSADYTVTRPNSHSMRWLAETRNVAHGWSASKEIFTDPARDALVMRTTFRALSGHSLSDFRLYVLHNPAMDNSGGADSSQTRVANGRTWLVASQGTRASALGISLPWMGAPNAAPLVSNGFVGVSDGYTDLLGGAADKTMSWAYDSAATGNVAQMGWIDIGGAGSSVSFDCVLAFGANETEAMNTGNAVLGSDLAALASTYDAQWQAYASSLDTQGGSADDQYYLAAMTLKTMQDKSNGAMIAGIGTPWGADAHDSNPVGYHLVWSRDLFKFANALVTAGDLQTGSRVVEYLFDTLMQQSDCGTSEGNPAPGAACPEGYSRNGRFPQNAWVSGFPYWPGTQLDEQGMPILLAWRVYEQGNAATQAQINALWPKLRATADFILNTGPWTHQERWEENSGYSPSTIAAAIAGLVAASRFALLNGDTTSAGRYLAAADYWQQNVTGWTFTTNGPHGNGKYFIRLNPSARSAQGSGPQRWNPQAGPNAALTFEIGNGGGAHDQREVVDGGFLELVRLGVKAATDPAIVESLPEYDAILKQSIPGKGDAWFRYNFDGYGERNDGGAYNGSGGRGRLWPIFTAERGMYEVARSGHGANGAAYLASVKAFATPEGFIPEQVWNQSASITGWQTTTPPGYAVGTPTQSIAPLNWAMGEYISLLASIHAERVVDIPAIVCQRYGTCSIAPAAGNAVVAINATASTVPGQHVYVTGNVDGLGNWNPDLGIPLDAAAYPVWKANVQLSASRNIEYKFYRKNADGSPTWESLPGGGNRSLATPASGNLALTASVKF